MTDAQFVSAGPHSQKVRCRVCGTAGYPTDSRGWQASHLRGHLPCSKGCGGMLTVKLDGSARAHSHCPTTEGD